MRIRQMLALTVLVAAAFGSTSAVGHQTVGTDPNGDKCGGAGLQVVSSPAGVFYADVRNVGGADEPGAFSIWIYMESNDHAGMQTKAGNPGDVLGDIDTPFAYTSENCTTPGHTIRADTLIF